MVARTTVPPAVRRRLMAVLMGSVGLNRTGFIAASTVASLVAEDMLGSATFAGLPLAIGTGAMALGTTPVAMIMERKGRRVGMVAGQLVAVGGAVLAAVAVGMDAFALFVMGMFVLGFGTAADRMTRYAAADIATAERRGSAIGLIVWSGTIGAVLGPTLLDPSQRVAEALGVEGLAGPFVMAAIVTSLAAVGVWALLRPDPLSFAGSEPSVDGTLRIRAALAIPSVRFAALSMLVSHGVMVLVMGMTPVHIKRAGDGLGSVGLVIAAHTLGMFAVSPITGWLADRYGKVRIMVIGVSIVIASCLLGATASGDDTGVLVVALFLLGFGWNFTFVAGSALLIRDVPLGWRVRLQGMSDGWMWAAAASASLAAGLLLEAGGFALVALVGAAGSVVPLVHWVRVRRLIATRV